MMSQAQPSESELIQRFREGERIAFDELVKRFRERAFWIAYNYTNNTEEAKDISQEAFLRVFKSLHKFDTKRNFYTWFYRILVNLCIDFLRKRKATATVQMEDLGEMINPCARPEARIEAVELEESVQAILNTLPLKYKTIMVLRDIQGFSCKEVAAITKCSHATVRWRLHRARKLFRETWEIRYKDRRYASNGLS